MSNSVCYLVFVPDQFAYSEVTKEEYDFCTNNLKVNASRFEQAFEKLKNIKELKDSDVGTPVFTALAALMHMKGVSISEFDIDGSSNMMININNPVAVQKLKAAIS